MDISGENRALGSRAPGRRMRAGVGGGPGPGFRGPESYR